MAWDTDSGLLDNYVLTITNAYFAPNEQYNGGQTTVLHVEGTTDDPDTPVLTRPELLTIGDGWVSYDGGKTVQNTKGRTQFVRNSAVGMWIERFKELDGAIAALKARGKLETESAAWIGLKVRLKREKIDYGGEIGTREKLLPVEFLGFVEGQAQAQAQAPVAVPVNTTPAPTNGHANGAGDLNATLADLARASDSHASFITQAMNIPQVATDPHLVARVVDASGIFAEARA